MSKSSTILPVLYFGVDTLVLAVTFLTATYYFNHHGYQNVELIFLTSLIFLWMIIAYLTKLYSSNLHNGFIPRLSNYAQSYVVFALFVILPVILLSQFPKVVENTILVFVVGFLTVNLFANSILVTVISRFRRNRKNSTYTLVAGVGDQAANIYNYFNDNPDYGYKIKGFLKCNGEVCKVNEKKIVGMVDDMKSFLEKNPIDEVIIALPYESPRGKIKEIINAADFQGVRISYVPDFEGLLGNRFKIIHEGKLDAVNVHTMPQDEVVATLEKGIFDLVFSSIVLVLLSPVFMLIAVWIKLDSPGPVFYCPVRVGRGGKNFTVFKFRTMHTNDAVLGGTQSTKKDDPRITKVGRKLRKYNLDELPQFLNVFLGDMSVVGPRPHRHFLNQQMKEHVDKYMIRHYFRPGVTGWAQVNGWRGPTETEEQISQRTAHDLWYIENWSFMLDLKIIWMTIFNPKARQNAF